MIVVHHSDHVKFTNKSCFRLSSLYKNVSDFQFYFDICIFLSDVLNDEGRCVPENPTIDAELVYYVKK